MPDEQKPLPLVNALSLAIAQANLQTLEQRVSMLEHALAAVTVDFTYLIYARPKDKRPLNMAFVDLINASRLACLDSIASSDSPLQEAGRWVAETLLRIAQEETVSPQQP